MRYNFYADWDGNYFRVGSTTRDANGKVNPHTHNYEGNPMRIEFPEDGASGDVTIQNIYDFAASYSVVKDYDVVGYYNADKKTVIIQTPFSTQGIGGSTRIGDFIVDNCTYKACIVGCEIGENKDLDGNYPLYLYSGVEFDVADDGTLTAKSPWLIYVFSGDGNGVWKVFNETEFLTSPMNEAKIVARPRGSMLPTYPDLTAS